MSTPSRTSAKSAPASPLTGYAGRPGRFDECRLPNGGVRPLWRQFSQLLGAEPEAALHAASEACRRAIIEQDVSMNVYAGDQSSARAWPLDAVPLLLGADDWAVITAGLQQRARLVNAILQDLYGPQKLLKQGVLPAPLAMANPHFLRACMGLGRPRQPFVHTYAADVARSPDGRWWVLEDRIDAPSGLGYSLQNRVIIRQVFPELFHQTSVRRLHRFFRDFRASLELTEPRRDGNVVAFLTPGPANETYFEHASLARYLGYPLVEGEDLTTRNREVFLRTVGGLKRVDVLVRRVDSEFSDPLELNERSVLGVPGLVGASQAGRVVLANQVGARALETTALLAFLPVLCRTVLSEELLMPSVATWWCGQPEALDYVLHNLHGLVVKATFPSADAPPTRYGALLDAAARAALADEIRARPWAYCGQERVFLGTTPGWDPAAGRLRAMAFCTRVFLSWHDGGYRAMPGGLTRCNPGDEEGMVSLQAGSITKDTWIVDPNGGESAVAEAAPTLVVSARHAHATPSRVADDFFWLGRYLERLAQLARLLDRLEPLMQDEISVLDPGVAEDAVRLVFALQELPVPYARNNDELAAAARSSAVNAAFSGSVVSHVGRLLRVMENLRVRLPRDAWRVARRLRAFTATAKEIPPWDDLRAHLATFDGVLAETLPHDTAWRFLDLGRRLERGCQVLHVLRGVLGTAGGAAPTEFRLQVALDVSDCLFAYRAVFHGTMQAPAVLAWLVADAENARSLRFQAEIIGEQLGALPDDLAPAAVAALRDRAFHLLGVVRLAHLPTLAADPGQASVLWTDLLDVHAELSDRISQIYFAHVDPRGVAANGN